VGEAAMESAIAERKQNGEFKSMEDFCQRLDSRKINKKVLESLVKCGAFDFTGDDRAAIFTVIDEALAKAASSHRDRIAGQHSLFDSVVEEETPKKRVYTHHVPPWPMSEKLGYEKELLGFYVTGHPLDEYRTVLEGGKYKAISSLAEQEDKSTLQVAGALEAVDKKFTKKDGKPFAIVILEDLTGSIEIMIWNEVFLKSSAHLEKGRVVSITARLDKRDDGLRLVASEVKPVKAPAASAAEPPLILYFEHDRTSEDDLMELKRTIQQYPGTRPLHFEFARADGQRLRMRLGTQYRVNLLPELKEKLAERIRV